MTWQILTGDCVEVMAGMDEASVDAIVTDPPYGLEFMGKEWDSLNAEKTGRKDFMPTGGRNYRHDGRDNVGGRLSKTAASPTPRKNPRCRRCGRLKVDKAPYLCKCEAPEWDTRTREFGWAMQAWHQAWATQALRVLKPGGHLLAFGGTRTYHRLAAGLEDAGFEIRDCLAWLYGSGFPKSLDVSKAIDKAAGAEREVVGTKVVSPDFEDHDGSMMSVDNSGGRNRSTLVSVTAPATPDAERWQGWGTALKPAFEPIVLARKPLVGTVAGNVLEYGTGALNIDGTRVGTGDDRASGGPRPSRPPTVDFSMSDEGERPEGGRWPANVVLDEEAAELLDEQSGELKTPASYVRSGAVGNHIYGQGMGQRAEGDTALGYGDTGGASRFFTVIGDEPCRVHGVRRCTICAPTRFAYVAKADRAERNRGLYGVSEHVCKVGSWRGSGTPKELQPLRDTAADTAEDDSGSSTTGSGSRLTVPSPTDIRSTTSTETRPTTASTTSNSSPQPSTSADTLPTSDQLWTDGSDVAGSAGSGSPRPPRTSTSPRRDGSSTGDAGRATSPESLATSAPEGACPNCGEVVRSRVMNSHPT